MEDIDEVLNKYDDERLASLIPKQMLKLSPQQKAAIEFAFWFCHAVEQDLNAVLTQAMEATNEIAGLISQELDDFIRDTYKIKLEKVDTSHTNYNPNDITFGDRIFVVEQLRGKTLHTEFLWKIKNIRDDLSHGRIHSLSYEGASLTNTETKRKMLKDYISLSANIDKEEVGGIVATLTDEQKRIIDEKYSNCKNNGD